MRRCVNYTVGLFVTTVIAIAPLAASCADKEVFDELRFGGSVSIQNRHTHESGVFAEATVFFDPFDYRAVDNWAERFMRPRVNVGISVSDDKQASQLFAGFDWVFDINEKIYAEAGFGGVLHDGALNFGTSGPDLGCHLLFHEYVGLGYRFDTHWNINAQVAHSSHANLCKDQPNDGMTRAGLLVGYRF